MRLAPALVAGLLLLWPASVRGEELSTRGSLGNGYLLRINWAIVR